MTTELTEEDGLTFAVRVVEDAKLPSRDRQLTRGVRGSPLLGLTAFESGFEMARKIILSRLKDEQDRRFKRMLTK